MLLNTCMVSYNTVSEQRMHATGNFNPYCKTKVLVVSKSPTYSLYTHSHNINIDSVDGWFHWLGSPTSFLSWAQSSGVGMSSLDELSLSWLPVISCHSSLGDGLLSILRALAAAVSSCSVGSDTCHKFSSVTYYRKQYIVSNKLSQLSRIL